MTQDKHTPGPWRVFDEDKVVAVAPYGRLIAECGVANARLIAAAPDMLESLEEVLPIVEAFGKPHHIAAIQDAIAKATGQ